MAGARESSSDSLITLASVKCSSDSSWTSSRADATTAPGGQSGGPSSAGALGATEGRGFEPLRACAQRFSRPPPYQLGLALPTMLRLNLQRRVLPEESRCLLLKRNATPRRDRPRR